MSEQREGREAIINILIEHNVGVLNTHGYSDMVEKLEALFSPDAGALEEAPDTDDAERWIAWLSDHSAGGYADVTVPGKAVGELVAALEDPACRHLIETWGQVIVESDDIAAIYDCTREMMREAAALHTGSEPADEAREHVGRALMYVSRALESPEVCASVNRETGGSAPELVQGLLDRITEIWATREAPEEVFACPNCAVAGVSVDEDGLCVTCGVDAPVFTLAKRLRSEAPALREALEEIEPMAHGKWGDHTPLVEVLDRIGRIARRALREAGGEHG